MASGIVAIYGGRFHPFHKGHKAVYDGLVKKFGNSKVFVATSDKTGPGSPFTFKEKRAMMLLAGVPSNAIKQEVSPYKPENTLSTVSKDTAVLFAVGQKDMAENPRFKPGLKKDGTATYYQDLDAWLKAGKKLEPFEKHGYLITIPSIKFTVLGKPAHSATQLRAQYQTLDDEKRKEFITDLFGAYDEVIQQVMDTRLTEGDMTADKKNPVAKPHIDKPEWKALHDMDDKIIQAYIKHKEVNESDSYTATIDKGDEVKVGRFKNRKATVKNITKDEHGQPVLKTNKGDHKLFKPRITKLENRLNVIEDSYWELLKRKIDPKIHNKRYQSAAERLHSVLQRKKKENAGKPFRHALGYYASVIAGSFRKIDSRVLTRYYMDNFDPVMTEELETPNSPQVKKVQDAITKGMDEWERIKDKEYASGRQPKNTHNFSPKGWASDKLSAILGIDDDGTVVIKNTHKDAANTVKKLAVLGGMAGVKTRIGTPEEDRKSQWQDKSGEKMIPYKDSFIKPEVGEELVTPNGEETSSDDGAVTSKLSGGVSPQMIAKQLPGVQDKQQLLQVLMKMKRGDTKYSRNQMIAAADAFKELIAKDPAETQKIMNLLKRVKAESKYQFEDINFDTA